MIFLVVALAFIRLQDRVSGWGKRLAIAISPYVLGTAAYLLIRWYVLHGMGVEKGERSWRQAIFTSPSIVLFYLRKLLLPVHLSGAYVNPIYSSPTAAFWLPAAAILLFVVSMTWLAFRVNPIFGYAAALILLPLLPVLATIRVYPKGDMTHDRYLYLPSVGLCLLLGFVADRIRQAKSVRIAAASVLAIVLCAFSVLTFAQQRFYDNDITYTQQEIDFNPANGFPYAMLGNVYMDQGQTDLALKNYRIAYERAPDDARISLLLSRGLFAVQQYTETEAILERLLLRTDLDARRQISVRLSLANVEIALGNLDSAQQLLQQVEQADPNFPELHWALGVLYKKQGQIRIAQSAFRKEYQLTGDPEAREQSDMLTMEILRTHPDDGSRP